jgi:hypothetical protein
MEKYPHYCQKWTQVFRPDSLECFQVLGKVQVYAIGGIVV